VGTGGITCAINIFVILCGQRPLTSGYYITTDRIKEGVKAGLMTHGLPINSTLTWLKVIKRNNPYKA
jgi:hypothetical protein